MKIRIVLIAALLVGLSLTGIAQQTQTTQSGSNTGSAQAGNEKPVGGKVKRQAKQAGQRVNVNTTNNSGSKSTSSMS